MNKLMKLLLAAGMCLGMMGCASGAVQDNVSKVVEKKEKSKDVAWEVGDCTAKTWVNSIGTTWIQIACPVTNTGKKNLYLSAATMDLEDMDGHLVDSQSYVSAFPEVLKPGETGYYFEETTLDEGMPTELKVLPHVNAKESKVDCIRFETSEISITDEQFGGVKVTGRVENTTDEDHEFVYVVAFLYDANNQLIGSEFTILNDELLAGDKIGFSMTGLGSPEWLTAGAVDHYEVYAYPQQYNF